MEKLEIYSANPCMEIPLIELDSHIKNDVLVENRKRQVESLLNDTPYVEMKLEEHEDYRPWYELKLRNFNGGVTISGQIELI